MSVAKAENRKTLAVESCQLFCLSKHKRCLYNIRLPVDRSANCIDERHLEELQVQNVNRYMVNV